MMLMNFIILQIVVFGVVIFLMKKIFMGDTQTAIKRLEKVNQDLLAKQKDLTAKIEESEKLYKEKKDQAEEVADKMKEEAIKESRAKGDELTKRARAEAEEIVQRAHQSGEKHAKEIEKEVRSKMTEIAASLLKDSLSAETLAVLHHRLVKEFVEKGEELNLTSVGDHIEQLVVKTPIELTKEEAVLLDALVKGCLKRKIKIEIIESKEALAGIVLQFGTLIIDGSLSNYIKEAVLKQKADIKSTA
jgi:F0F1-type ATP synthase membrane subunit b/b'